jgi:zinc transporter ZupT
MPELIFTTIVLSISILFSLIHYFSHNLSDFLEKYHYKVLSFSGGTLIALIFLVLFPEVIRISSSPWIYLFILLGFTIFHLSEKFLYQHVKDKKQKLKELKELHIIGFFVDHYILGFVVVTVLDISGSIGFLILIPIFLQTISSSFVMAHIHEKAKTNFNKLALSVAPILGTITALLLKVDESVQAIILAFILGLLLYIVGMDIIPKKEKGSPTMFIYGIAIVVIIWLFLTLIVG